jgi:hypothetical protein
MQAGLEGDQIITIVESIERDQTAVRPQSAAAVRQKRYRDRKAENRQDVTDDVTSYVTDDVTPKGTLDKEGFPHTPSQEINPPKEKTPKGVQKKTPRAILEQTLSGPQAAAVLEHRQRIRKPLTERAAELLAEKFSQAAQVGFTPDQAADLMISRGWQGFELDWARGAKPLASSTPISTSDDDWIRRLRFARSKRWWSVTELGPMPGQPGCRVPARLLEPGDGEGWSDSDGRAAA